MKVTKNIITPQEKTSTVVYLATPIYITRVVRKSLCRLDKNKKGKKDKNVRKKKKKKDIREEKRKKGWKK